MYFGAFSGGQQNQPRQNEEKWRVWRMTLLNSVTSEHYLFERMRSLRLSVALFNPNRRPIENTTMFIAIENKA